MDLSSAHLICTSQGEGAIKITFNTNSDQAESISVSSEQKFTVVSLGIVPDYDHNDRIVLEDINLAKTGKRATFWVNDDKDGGDFTSHGKDTPSTDFPGQTDGNGHDNVVNGRSDLIDFTPLWLDLKEVMNILPPGGANKYRIRSRGVRVVQTGLPIIGIEQFWRGSDESECGATLDQPAHSASVIPAVLDGKEQVAELSPAFLAKMVDNPETYGYLMVEGSFEGASLELEVVDPNGVAIFSIEAPLRFVPVESMYRWINLRSVTGGSVDLPTKAYPPLNYQDSECNGKHFIFVHGLNVNEHDARCSGAEMFKRLYKSGSKAMYTAVAWNGNQGQAYYDLDPLVPGFGRRTSDYYANVVNAFNTAPALATAVAALPGTKIISAHSLGNILVSSAIHDHQLAVSKYFMLNAAVAAETLDSGRFNKTAAENPMVHDEWRNYLPKTSASCWHELFNGEVDGRGELTWEGRFSGVLPVAYNYYSSGDEAFETYGTTPNSTEGYDRTKPGTGRYSWSKQELYKGRNNSDDAIVASTHLGSDWAGWGFNGVPTVIPNPGGLPKGEWTRIYDVVTANGLLPVELMATSVFYPTPPSMFSATIEKSLQNRILAYGIPALSTAIGHESVNLPQQGDEDKNIDMNALNRPNGWWRPKSFGDLGERWLHSDMFEVAYCYVYEVFNDFVERGELK